MDLRTIVPVKELSHPIEYSAPVVLMGSCFTEHIGERLTHAGFHAVVNPLGISFNPLSICTGLDYLCSVKDVTADELVERDGVWHHFDFHSSLSGLDKNQVAAGMNASLQEGRKAIGKASHLMITLGTAWLYRLGTSDGDVVNNCHKFPANQFHRSCATQEEIVTSLRSRIKALQLINPEIQILFTLSPVRHWKDGAEANSISKSILRLAIADLCEADDNCEYFPAYEVMMDELRDYRFYANDMLHPSSLAQEIIWKKFSLVAISNEDQMIAEEISAFHRMQDHRSLFPDSAADQKFKEQLEAKRADLSKKYSFFRG